MLYSPRNSKDLPIWKRIINHRVEYNVKDSSIINNIDNVKNRSWKVLSLDIEYKGEAHNEFVDFIRNSIFPYIEQNGGQGISNRSLWNSMTFVFNPFKIGNKNVIKVKVWMVDRVIRPIGYNHDLEGTLKDPYMKK